MGTHGTPAEQTYQQPGQTWGKNLTAATPACSRVQQLFWSSLMPYFIPLFYSISYPWPVWGLVLCIHLAGLEHPVIQLNTNLGVALKMLGRPDAYNRFTWSKGDDPFSDLISWKALRADLRFPQEEEILQVEGRFRSHPGVPSLPFPPAQTCLTSSHARTINSLPLISLTVYLQYSASLCILPDVAWNAHSRWS